VPLLRTSKDTRGYEHTYVIHVPEAGGGDRPRILYWFRTPPGVKVGREAIDAAARQALETQYPAIVFDWRTLVAAPPQPDTPNWRERRLAARAAKQARAAASSTEDPADAASGQAQRQPASSGARKRRRGRSVGDRRSAGAPSEAPTNSLKPAETPPETS
jgi:hypothetical protein